MKIIEIKESQKENWNESIAENNSESFLQSWQWSEFQQKTGKKIFKIGIEDNGDLLAVALLIKQNLPFGKSYLYCPRGPVILASSIKYQISNICDLLFDEVKRIAKEEKCMFLRVDPPIARGFHSVDGFIVLKGCGTQNAKLQMRIHGPSRTMEPSISFFDYLKKAVSEIQPRDTLILNLEKSEEELLRDMKQKTRYNIRLAEKKGVKIISSTDYEKYFPNFWNLVEETSLRNKIISHRKEYYLKMLESLAMERPQTVSNMTMARKIQDTRNKNQKITNNQKTRDNQNLSARLYLAEYEGKIIAANVVLFFGDLAIYLHGASSNDYRNLMAPYLLQWRQIQDAKNEGYKKYDFWGITIDGEKETWQGITKFKKGFGGEEKSYLGAFDLPIDKLGYKLYQILRKVKQ